MGKRNLKEGLEEIRGMVGEPVKLSDVEKERFRKVIEQIKELFDDNLEVMLEMDRDDAYRYLNLLIQAFQQADANFVAGAAPAQIEAEEAVEVEEPKELDEETQLRPSPKVVVAPGEKPNFDKIMEKLTDGERGKAKAYLDCVKTAMELKESGDDSNQVLCNAPDRICSADEMRRCIASEDPSIDTSQDIIDEVNAARESGELPPRR